MNPSQNLRKDEDQKPIDTPQEMFELIRVSFTRSPLLSRHQLVCLMNAVPLLIEDGQLYLKRAHGGLEDFVNLRDIIYIRSQRNWITLVARNMKGEVYMYEHKITLTEFMNRMPDYMSRVHRSYAINLQFAPPGWRSNEKMTLTTGDTVRVSEAYRYRLELHCRMKVVRSSSK